jgi:hypothetical protein
LKLRAGFGFKRVEASGFHAERSDGKIHLRQIPQGGTLHLEDAEEAGF